MKTSSSMSDDFGGLPDTELVALFDRLFPAGVAGPDVMVELAPDGWAQSALMRCFHPTVDRVFEERLQFHRNLAELRLNSAAKIGRGARAAKADPEPTIESVRDSYEETPVDPAAELTELIGMCLWDVFSDNHDVRCADGRTADIGSFRGASAFLDEYIGTDHHTRGRGDYLRFYLGTWVVAGRADLTPVYALIFRRLLAIGADWVYRFPELHLLELGATTSPKLRAEIAAANAEAREAALDQPAPAIVRAYRAVYGCDPSGWPPA
jgi:hypothetical protein